MNWTNKQIGQIIHLVQRRHALDDKIDRRTVRDKKVQEWAVNAGLAIWECQHGVLCDAWSLPPWSHTYIDRNSDEEARRCNWALRFRTCLDIGSRHLQFNAEYDLPPAALWHFVSQFLFFEDGSPVRGSPRGYSINLQHGWLELDIFYEGHHWDKEDKDWQRRVTALNRLDQAGYITFQSAGSVWQITVSERQQ